MCPSRRDRIFTTLQVLAVHVRGRLQRRNTPRGDQTGTGKTCIEVQYCTCRLYGKNPGTPLGSDAGRIGSPFRGPQVPVVAVPNSAPTPAVSAMARAPQNVTRI